MKITAHAIIAALPPIAKITHNNEEIDFSVAVFQRQTFTTQEYDVFEHINKFWGSLSEAEQTEIFDIYKKINWVFVNVFTTTELVSNLEPLIKQILNIHNFERMNNWIGFKSGIVIPNSFEADYTYSIDNNTSREKTYTYSDYSKLVTLSLMLRTMIPIWGEYISNIRQVTGTMFKEYNAFQLLCKTDVINLPAVEKLKLYIDNIVGSDKEDMNKNINNISSDDVGFWLLALVCVRRLCIGDIRGFDPKAHLITFIYKFIIQKIRNEDNAFEHQVKPKIDDSKSLTDDNKTTSLERYKIKTNVSLGEITELEYSLRDIRGVADKLSININKDMLEQSLLTSRSLVNENIAPPQLTLLSWIFKPVISPTGLMYVSKINIINCLAILQCVLWARNFKYMAILSTSYPVLSDKEMVVSPVETKNRVPKELLDELDQIYPYVRISSNKKQNTNLVLKSIDMFCDNVAMFTWKPTASDEIIEHVFGAPIRRLPPRQDFKIEVTRLVIELGKRNWV